MKPVISWMGNKRLMTSRLLPLVPEHHTYVEVFAGSAALLLAKERSEVEVLNDLDGELINFYRVARYHREALVSEIEWMPLSRQEFDDIKAQRGLTDIQRAARWLFRNKFSFGGRGQHWGRSKAQAPIMRRTIIAGIYELGERLDGVWLENQDWTGILGFYDMPETFFFLDPPYADTEHYEAQAAPWREADHERLATAIRGLAGSWLLTYNDHPLIRRLYDGCRMEEIAQSHSLPNQSGQQKMHQLIIWGGGSRRESDGG